MNSVQVHLALNHAPVILSIVGLVMLIVASFIKNQTLTKTSYIVIVVAGVAAIPVFFTGEGTEEVIENLPGVSDAIIESHEEMAKLAMFSITAAGMVSLAALFSFRWVLAVRLLKIVVLILSITSGAFMVQTAHLGGKIRHTEIRNGLALQDGNKIDGENNGNDQQQQEKDND